MSFNTNSKLNSKMNSKMNSKTVFSAATLIPLSCLVYSFGGFNDNGNTTNNNISNNINNNGMSGPSSSKSMSKSTTESKLAENVTTLNSLNSRPIIIENQRSKLSSDSSGGAAMSSLSSMPSMPSMMEPSCSLCARPDDAMFTLKSSKEITYQGQRMTCSQVQTQLSQQMPQMPQHMAAHSLQSAQSPPSAQCTAAQSQLFDTCCYHQCQLCQDGESIHWSKPQCASVYYDIVSLEISGDDNHGGNGGNGSGGGGGACGRVQKMRSECCYSSRDGVGSAGSLGGGLGKFETGAFDPIGVSPQF